MARMPATVPATAGRPRFPLAMLRRWRGLAARERGMLLLMLAAMAGAGLWVGWWEPLQRQRTHWQGELPRLRERQRELQGLLNMAQRQREAAVLDTAALRTQLQASGLNCCITLGRDRGRWQLAVRDAPADTLWNWLLPVLADPAAPLQELKLERTGDPNMAVARVSGTIVMGQGTAGGGTR